MDKDKKALLDTSVIGEQMITADAWAHTHGAIAPLKYLGTGILYYAFAYMQPAKTAVILGSGDGFVPRLVRQAQREIPDPEFIAASRCIVVDLGEDRYQFGAARYHDQKDHFLRTMYPEIEVWRMTTDAALEKMQQERIEIDFLHIDAEHTFQQSLKDFENYLPLMRDDFIITLHDTAVNHLDLYLDGCVARTVAYLRAEMQNGGKYDHLEMINFNNRKKNSKNHFGSALTCCGTAVIVPKIASIWDTQIGACLCLNGNISVLPPSKSDS